MLEYYIYGAVFALILNVLVAIYNVIKGLSAFRINMELVGYRYRWIMGNYADSNQSISSKIWGVISMFVIPPITSWIHIIWMFVVLIIWIVNRSRTPSNVRDLQDRLKHTVLTKEAVSEILHEINRVTTNQNLILPIDSAKASELFLQTLG